MTKSKLITLIAAKRPHLLEKNLIKVVNHIIECLSETLARGKRIEIRGFGSFNLHYRGPRQAHNPKTGEKVMTEPKYTPHFKAGKELRERVNKGKNQPPSADRQDPGF